MKFSWKAALAEAMVAQAIDQREALIRGELQMACLMHG
jgi:hypothetical protein